MTSQESSSGRHAGKTALITGASSGLGRADAVRLASEGAKIVIIDLNSLDETEKLVREHGVDALAMTVDITSEQQVLQLKEAVFDSFGRCDILVNNAAVHAPRPAVLLDQLPRDIWEKTLAVNLTGMFIMCQAFTPAMCANGWGRVINISSNTFGQVMRGMSAYITTKAGVIGFSRALASEVGEFGVTVNSILPGLTRTEHSGLSRSADEYVERARRQAIPRVGTPEDIAAAVSFLASEDSGFITAQTLVVDGGYIRH